MCVYVCRYIYVHVYAYMCVYMQELYLAHFRDEQEVRVSMYLIYVHK